MKKWLIWYYLFMKIDLIRVFVCFYTLSQIFNVFKIKAFISNIYMVCIEINNNIPNQEILNYESSDDTYNIELNESKSEPSETSETSENSNKNLLESL